MTIDDVFRTKLTTKDLGAVLGHGHSEVLASPGPIRVPNPQRVFTTSWYFKILVERRTRFISTCGGGVPLALATLRPFGRNAWSIHPPTGSLLTGRILMGRIEKRFTEFAGRETTHVLGFVPEVLSL